MFKGTRDQEAFFQKIMGKYGKTGTSLTNQQGEIVEDIITNNPEFLKSNSQMTSALVAQFGKGGDLEKSSKERNELLKRIVDNQLSRGGGTTNIVDAKTITTTTSDGGGTPQTNITQDVVTAVDPEFSITN